MLAAAARPACQRLRIYALVEEGRGYDQRLIDGYLSGVDPSKLAKASQIVNSGLNSPIKDVGF
jgi:hypothetical protein